MKLSNSTAFSNIKELSGLVIFDFTENGFPSSSGFGLEILVKVFVFQDRVDPMLYHQLSADSSRTLDGGYHSDCTC